MLPVDASATLGSVVFNVIQYHTVDCSSAGFLFVLLFLICSLVTISQTSAKDLLVFRFSLLWSSSPVFFACPSITGHFVCIGEF